MRGSDKSKTSSLARKSSKIEHKGLIWALCSQPQLTCERLGQSLLCGPARPRLRLGAGLASAGHDFGHEGVHSRPQFFSQARREEPEVTDLGDAQRARREVLVAQRGTAVAG